MQLFYQPDIVQDAAHIVFNSEESRHLVKVLRKKPGDAIWVTDGKGSLFTCEVELISSKNVSAKVLKQSIKNPEKYQLHLAIAPTKSTDRLEWFLEKATEIGIHRITPIICDHSERTVLKTERLEKIVEAAMKQSLRCFLPKIDKPIPFKEFIAENTSADKFVAHCVDSKKKLLKNLLSPHRDVLILIGPEGDFSKKEIDLALTLGFEPASLGEKRLRTETAALVACHTVVLINQ
ncbi:MAG: 16S rRNA (uracil(1498)-N(3))-methyltransferase [Flavobacteriales bacterium CG_4_9_14_3_um_filter_40_17]|nr:MAG: 16S rRNA (uracil(1498)-N(3))-methyltransferase [Flavobacteriales bacterium CG_4_9_14_3_um_filter_40_17]